MLTDLDYGAAMTGDIQNAITDSVRMNRALTVEASPEMLDYAIGLGDGNACDHGSVDVWGLTRTGGQWRLRITVA